MIDTKIVLERLKSVLGIQKDTELAEFLEISPQQLAQAKKRDNIPYQKIIERASLGKYHLDYVFLGVGKKSPANASFDFSEGEKIDDIVESKEMAKMLSDLLKYGNKDLYENIKEKIEAIKSISKQ